VDLDRGGCIGENGENSQSRIKPRGDRVSGVGEIQTNPSGAGTRTNPRSGVQQNPNEPETLRIADLFQLASAQTNPAGESFA
jgi:hypothetical protein